MKRTDMIERLVYETLSWDGLDTSGVPLKEVANDILTALEKAGMKPPRLDEDKCQAILHVYYAGYNFNQWDEDFEKDERVVAALARRLAAKKAREEKRNAK